MQPLRIGRAAPARASGQAHPVDLLLDCHARIRHFTALAQRLLEAQAGRDERDERDDGVGFVFISYHGDVFPSGFLPVSAGNVRTDDLAQVYRESPLFRSLRDLDAIEGKCGVCPFKRVCGGSRASAYATSSNALGADPLCAYVPKGWLEDDAPPPITAAAGLLDITSA